MIEIKTSAYVTRLILNRPEKKNALSLKMMDELLYALKNVSTRIAIIEGNGSFFCSGMDLEDVIVSKEQCIEKMAEIFQTIVSLPQVTLAKVVGGAFAGGLGLAAACDFVYANETAIFALPEIRRGLVPSLVYALLKNQVSRRALNAFILTAEPISAKKAESMGLINAAVPGDLDGYCNSQIQILLKSAPDAIKMYKKAFQTNLAEDFKIALQIHQELSKEETEEGLRAFLEKRPPKWEVITL